MSSTCRWHDCSTPTSCRFTASMSSRTGGSAPSACRISAGRRWPGSSPSSSSVPADRRSGQSLLDVLDRAQQASPWPQSGASPARRFLAQSSYVRAVCWIGACLADALQYAHERGLVHMDVKPSNILLTADGQPMLLDFHLAREPIPIGEPPADGVGGTPGYMSPEQEAMVAAMDSGRAVLAAVDARSDLYSLGRVLAEMLGAEARRAAGARPPQSWRFMPEVSTGLADLIRKCLATDPNDRYPDAAALADDLRRHMADLPLRGVSNRSLRERWRKWCRRQPYELFRVKTLLVASCAAVTIAALVWVAFLAPRFRAAEQALLEGRVLLDRRDYPEAARALTRGAALDRGPSRRRTAVAGTGRGAPPDGPPGGGRPPPPPRRSPALRRIGRQPPRPVGEGSRAALPRPLGIAPLAARAARNAARPRARAAAPGRPARPGGHRVEPARAPGDRPEEGRRGAPRGPRAPRRSRGVVRPEPRPLPRAAGARHRPGPLEHGRRRRPRRIPGAAANGLGTRRRRAASCSRPATSPRPRRPSSGPSPSGPRTYGRISIRACAPSASAATRMPSTPFASASRWPPIVPSASTTAPWPTPPWATPIEASRDYRRAVSLDPTLAAAPLDRGVPHHPTAPSRPVTP